MPGETRAPLKWKDFYASNIFEWHLREVDGNKLLFRRQGIVENIFDIDGTDFEGRADLNMNPTIKLDFKIADGDLRERILLAWACLRHVHPLLSCKSLYRDEFLPEKTSRMWINKCFVYERPKSPFAMLDAASQNLTFVQDSYRDVQLEDFFVHLTNTARTVNERESLSKLIVMPFQPENDSVTLSLFLVAGHQVADGLTTFRWVLSLIDLLHMEDHQLIDRMGQLCSRSQSRDMVSFMPPAQESLYPRYAANLAQDQWNWAVTRILRHVHRPPPACFQNPLRRDKPLSSTEQMLQKYSKVLDYSRVPPLNGYWIGADLPQRATANLYKLCKQAGISVSSGAFTLVGMILMRFEEQREPGLPYWERLPFVGSFPVNPRPFLSGPATTGKEDSLMLAFSDGVTLPFIPSDFDLVKTFRVLGRLAHRQLRQYQKKQRTAAEEAHLGSRSPRELLPALYLTTLERLEGKAKPERTFGFDLQGKYPAKHSPTLATCGISSVGSRAALSAGAPQLSNGRGDPISHLTDFRTSVRPRDGEFLVGAFGTPESMQFRASYDGSAIDPKKAQAWKNAIMSILDFDMELGQDQDTMKRQDPMTGKVSKL